MGHQVAGLPGRRVAYKGLRKIVCLASPHVAGLPGRQVADANLIVLQLRLHDLGPPGCRVAASLSRSIMLDCI